MCFEQEYGKIHAKSNLCQLTIPIGWHEFSFYFVVVVVAVIGSFSCCFALSPTFSHHALVNGIVLYRIVYRICSSRKSWNGLHIMGTCQPFSVDANVCTPMSSFRFIYLFVEPSVFLQFRLFFSFISGGKFILFVLGEFKCATQ